MMRPRLNENNLWVMWIVIALGVNFSLLFAWVWEPPNLPLVEFDSSAAMKVVPRGQSVTLGVSMRPPPKGPVEVPVSYEGDIERGKIYDAGDKVIIDSAAMPPFA